MNDHVVAPSRENIGGGAGALDSRSICDRLFVDNVIQLRAVQSYLIQQAKTTDASIAELGRLSALQFGKSGRFPTHDEYVQLEKCRELYLNLEESDRRRFLSGQIPSWVLKAAVVLGILALVCIVVGFSASVVTNLYGCATAVAPNHPCASNLAPNWELFHRLTLFIAFLGWMAALGGIGSIAFIGMNALAVLQDATFDINNNKLILLRIILGSLFCVVITLPVGYGVFTIFISELFAPQLSSDFAINSVFLLLPFLVGFSTTLVIMILTQFIDAGQAFFGKKRNLD